MLDVEIVVKIVEIFIEVVIVFGVLDEVKEIFVVKKNLCLLLIDGLLVFCVVLMVYK